MQPDDELCLCFHVTRRKVANYLRIEKPQRVAQLSECYGAGTGCGWCRPFLERMFQAAQAGDAGDRRAALCRRLRPPAERLRPRRRRHAPGGRHAHRSAIVRGNFLSPEWEITAELAANCSFTCRWF